MRVHKVVSFFVVILLIAVLFAGVVTVSAAAQSTQLSLSASAATPPVGQSVTFTAALKSGTVFLSSKSVTI